MNLFKPTRYWGPYLKKHRRLMLRYLEPSQVELDPWNEVNGNPVQMDDIKVIISQQQGWADYRTKEIDYDYLRMA